MNRSKKKVFKKKRFVRRKNTTRAIARRALKISKDIASNIETKFYSLADVAFLNPISGLKDLPLTSSNVSANGLGAIGRPLHSLSQGATAFSRIGTRIKVRYIDVNVSIDSLSGATTEYKLEGCRYQFVIFQHVTQVVDQGITPTSFAGRYWQLNNGGQIQQPSTSFIDPWAHKAIDSRFYTTKTIVRKCGVIKPCTAVTFDGAGAFVRTTANKASIFKGRIRLPVSDIVFAGQGGTSAPVNDVFFLFVCDSRTNAALDDQVVINTVVAYTDA